MKPLKFSPGQRFGRWTVVQEADSSTKGGSRTWLCVCTCGKRKEIYASHLKQGTSKSCGCLRRETAGEYTTHHGYCRPGRISGTWYAWQNMRKRCTNPSLPYWHLYGGRGITFCDRWKKFENFLADMGERPKGLTLDRIDVDGNYEPGNCRWATWREQRMNQRRMKKEKM